MEEMVEKKTRRTGTTKIEKRQPRNVTSTKRRKGLFKKAEALSKISGYEIGLLVYTPGGRPDTSASGPNAPPCFDDLLHRYLQHRNHHPVTTSESYWWKDLDVSQLNPLQLNQLSVTLTHLLNYNLQQLAAEEDRGVGISSSAPSLPTGSFDCSDNPPTIAAASYQFGAVSSQQSQPAATPSISSEDFNEADSFLNLDNYNDQPADPMSSSQQQQQLSSSEEEEEEEEEEHFDPDDFLNLEGYSDDEADSMELQDENDDMYFDPDALMAMLLQS